LRPIARFDLCKARDRQRKRRDNVGGGFIIRNRPPSEGERRALGGYYPQIRLVAAHRVLEALRTGALQWIRVADPDAGRIDDIQIGGDSRVDAYQVKWAIDGGTFTFNRLITPDGEAPSLIAQLADGALRIGAFHPGCAVFVHLVTNEIPSVSDKLPAATPRPAPGHFSAFLNQAWYPIHRGEIIQVPQIWLEAWERLRQAAAVSEDQWLGFVSQCVLEFGYRPPETTYVSRCV